MTSCALIRQSRHCQTKILKSTESLWSEMCHCDSPSDNEQCFPGDENKLPGPFFSPFTPNPSPYGFFFPKPKPIPLCFYSKAILCFPEGHYSSSCFPAITFLLTNLKPKFLISTSSSNQLYFSISLPHGFLITV